MVTIGALWERFLLFPLFCRLEKLCLLCLCRDCRLKLFLLQYKKIIWVKLTVWSTFTKKIQFNNKNNLFRQREIEFSLLDYVPPSLDILNALSKQLILQPVRFMRLPNPYWIRWWAGKFIVRRYSSSLSRRGWGSWTSASAYSVIKSQRKISSLPW